MSADNTGSGASQKPENDTSRAGSGPAPSFPGAAAKGSARTPKPTGAPATEAAAPAARKAHRNDRRHEKTGTTRAKGEGTDLREPGERDRDRILYTSAFRRLAGITQVAAADLSHPFLHNRLTHVLEVAQIGRRIAQRLLRQPAQKEVAERIGGLDPEVVEAACLAHDLGHPPFGHIAEYELNRLAGTQQVLDGFEGNAQTFRVVTKLAVRRPGADGLDLTRATLNAILKYPWMRGAGGKREGKWGAYSTERADFEFARELDPGVDRKSVEAELMDWADDIAYSINDVDDYFQAGKIPLDRLLRDPQERAEFLDAVYNVWLEFGWVEELRLEHLAKTGTPETDSKDEKDRQALAAFEPYRVAFEEMVQAVKFPFAVLERPFTGDPKQSKALRALTSLLTNRYINGIKLVEPSGRGRLVEIDDNKQREVEILKELTWHYVIRDSSLAAQQEGQRKVINGLFEIFLDACGDRRRWHLFPASSREYLAECGADSKDRNAERVRAVLDLIAGMSEQQAVAMYHRMHGISADSSLSPIIV